MTPTLLRVLIEDCDDRARISANNSIQCRGSLHEKTWGDFATYWRQEAAGYRVELNTLRQMECA